MTVSENIKYSESLMQHAIGLNIKTNCSHSSNVNILKFAVGRFLRIAWNSRGCIWTPWSFILSSFSVKFKNVLVVENYFYFTYFTKRHNYTWPSIYIYWVSARTWNRVAIIERMTARSFRCIPILTDTLPIHFMYVRYFCMPFLSLI